MLEQKIEELTQAVNKLIDAINSDKQSTCFLVKNQDPLRSVVSGDSPVIDEVDAPATEEPKPRKTRAKKAEPTPEPVQDETLTAVNISDPSLISACSTAVRKNPDNRAKIKEHMVTYKVGRVGELPVEVRAEFLAFVEGL